MIEVAACADPNRGFIYFANKYLQIYNATLMAWLNFTLWYSQAEFLYAIHKYDKVVVLKPRQIGATWTVLFYALWLMIFRAPAQILLMSKTESEAAELIDRLRGMLTRLPDFLRPKLEVDNYTQIKLVNGSRALGFSTTRGDSYTATLVIVDEADLNPDLQRVMQALEPTMADGGKIVLLSRANKQKPVSYFKRIYRSATQGANNYYPIFFPWWARPDRTLAWYEAQVQDSLANGGSLDNVWESYPETPEQALAGLQLDKRIALKWLEKCYHPLPLLEPPPSLRTTRLYEYPARYGRYIIGVDTAEGNVNSDDTAITIFNLDSLAQTAVVQGKYEPDATGALVATLSGYFNNADVLIERNHHGHSVISWLKNFAPDVRLLRGRDGKTGFQTNTLTKTLGYNEVAIMVRDGHLIIRDEETLNQLAALDATTLSAEPDDVADSVMLAVWGMQEASSQNIGTLTSRDDNPSSYERTAAQREKEIKRTLSQRRGIR